MTAALLFLVACGDDEPMTTGTQATNSTGTATANPVTTNDPATSATGETSGTSTTTTGMTTDMMPTTGAMSTTGTGSADGGPIFLSFGTNVGALTEGESVIFTAILTDPDGINDIVGGTLKSVDEALQFGPFVAAGQPGTYSVTLSWAQIHQVDPIEFTAGSIGRGFRAVFFDQKGHKATDDVEVQLSCAGGAACAGSCMDLASDGLNCGTCGRVCDGGEDACESGACQPTFGSCFGYNDGVETCAEACLAAGEMCVTQGCEKGATAMYFSTSDNCEMVFSADYDIQSCDEVHVWTPNAMYIRCCCTDTK